MVGRFGKRRFIALPRDARFHASGSTPRAYRWNTLGDRESHAYYPWAGVERMRSGLNRKLTGGV